MILPPAPPGGPPPPPGVPSPPPAVSPPPPPGGDPPALGEGGGGGGGGKLGLYKVFVCSFGDCSLSYTILVTRHFIYPPPVCCDRYCAIYGFPPTCFAIQHTNLLWLLAKSCKGQGGGRGGNPVNCPVRLRWDVDSLCSSSSCVGMMISV